MSRSAIHALNRVLLTLSFVLLVSAWWCHLHAKKVLAERVATPPNVAFESRSVSAGPSMRFPKEGMTSSSTSGAPSKWIPPPIKPESDAERAQRLATAAKSPMGPLARVLDNRIRVRMRYGALYVKLGLTRDQIDRFETAAAEKFGSINVFGIAFGMYPEEEQRRHFETHARNLDELVGQVLGPKAVPEFRAFLEQSDIREVVNRVALQAFPTSPLQEAQRAQLLMYCMEARQAPAGVRTDPATIDWNVVIGRSAEILDAPQQAALRNVTQLRSLDNEYRRITGLPYRRPVRGI